MSKNPINDKKTDRSEILEVINSVVIENSESDKIVIPVTRMVYHFYDKKNKNVSDSTLRRYGYNPNGVYVSDYPKVFSWYSQTRDKRGLMFNIDKYIENALEDYFLDLFDNQKEYDKKIKQPLKEKIDLNE